MRARFFNRSKERIDEYRVDSSAVGHMTYPLSTYGEGIVRNAKLGSEGDQKSVEG